MVELPASPDFVLIVVHDGAKFVSIPVERLLLLEGDAAIIFAKVIERADRDLQADPFPYRGGPGEHI